MLPRSELSRERFPELNNTRHLTHVSYAKDFNVGSFRVLSIKPNVSRHVPAFNYPNFYRHKGKILKSPSPTQKKRGKISNVAV